MDEKIELLVVNEIEKALEVKQVGVKAFRSSMDESIRIIHNKNIICHIKNIDKSFFVGDTNGNVEDYIKLHNKIRDQQKSLMGLTCVTCFFITSCCQLDNEIVIIQNTSLNYIIQEVVRGDDTTLELLLS